MPNGNGLRAQALAGMLASIAEYRAASPAFRPFWRRCALHDIRRVRRDYLQPERAAFEFRFTATLLRGYSAPDEENAPCRNSTLFQAVCSNNLSIILAALDQAAERKP